MRESGTLFFKEFNKKQQKKKMNVYKYYMTTNYVAYQWTYLWNKKPGENVEILPTDEWIRILTPDHGTLGKCAYGLLYVQLWHITQFI